MNKEIGGPDRPIVPYKMRESVSTRVPYKMRESVASTATALHHATTPYDVMRLTQCSYRDYRSRIFLRGEIFEYCIEISAPSLALIGFDAWIWISSYPGPIDRRVDRKLPGSNLKIKKIKLNLMVQRHRSPHVAASRRSARSRSGPEVPIER
eukprot:7555154-Pyramimonas_sp.AAC.1